MKDLRVEIVKIICSNSGIDFGTSEKIANQIFSILPPPLGEEEIKMLIIDKSCSENFQISTYATNTIAKALAHRIPKPSECSGVSSCCDAQMDWEEDKNYGWYVCRKCGKRCNYKSAPKRKQKFFISACCNASVKVDGIGDFEKTACTQSYVCDACGKPCDLANWNKPDPKPQIEELDIPELAVCDYGDTNQAITHMLTLGRKIQEIIKVVNAGGQI